MPLPRNLEKILFGLKTGVVYLDDMTEDSKLLIAYHRNGSQPAFAELVQRHLPLVYASARRRLPEEPGLAADVCQKVFATLAQHAGRLQAHPCLDAWLHLTTMHAALDLRKQ